MGVLPFNEEKLVSSSASKNQLLLRGALCWRGNITNALLVRHYKHYLYVPIFKTHSLKNPNRNKKNESTNQWIILQNKFALDCSLSLLVQILEKRGYARIRSLRMDPVQRDAPHKVSKKIWCNVEISRFGSWINQREEKDERADLRAMMLIHSQRARMNATRRGGSRYTRKSARRHAIWLPAIVNIVVFSWSKPRIIQVKLFW